MTQREIHTLRYEKGEKLEEVGMEEEDASRERERGQGAGNWKEGGPDPVWSSVSQTPWP